jgi:hypothetical protein
MTAMWKQNEMNDDGARKQEVVLAWQVRDILHLKGSGSRYEK